MWVKWVSIFMAVLLVVTSIPLTLGVITVPPFGGDSTDQVASDSVFRVVLSSKKDKCFLLGKMEFTATITNISSSTVNNVSAEALFGKDIKPLQRDSQITATKASLTPGESFQLHYSAVVASFKGIDFLVMPYVLAINLLRGGWVSPSASFFNDGRSLLQVSKGIKISSISTEAYDASTTVRVWYGESQPYEPPVLDDKEGVWHEVIDNIDIIVDSPVYTGNRSHDSALAQATYEELISFLETKKQQGYVKSYTVSEDGITYKLSTGLVGGLSWEHIYPPVWYREIQTQNVNMRPTTQISQSLTMVALASNSNSKLNIAVLQPRYNNSHDTKLFGHNPFKTSLFDEMAQEIVKSNSNYQISTSLKDGAVTIEAMKNLENNRIIIFDSHGKMLPEANNSYGIQLGIEITFEMSLKPEYYSEFYPEAGQTPRMVRYEDGVMLTTEFFRYYYKDKTFDNTLFYSGACRGADSNGFFNALNARGVSTLLAYKEPVHPNYANKMFGTIFGKSGLLGTSNSAIKTAVLAAKSAHGEKDNSWFNEYGDWLKSFKWFGGRPNTPPAELVLFGDENWSLDKTYTPNFGELSGVVKDTDTQAPLAGVAVKAYDTNGNLVEQIQTMTDGTFYFPELLEGSYTFTYSLDGYITANNGRTISGNTHNVWLSPILLKKQSGGEPTQGTITGKVIEQGTSVPLAGVLVEARYTGTATVIASSTTNANGLYSLTVSTGNNYDLTYTKSGYVSQTREDISLTDSISDVAMALDGGGNYEATTLMIATGAHHTVALKSDGTVWTWGANSSGQLGDGTTTDRFSPVQVSSLSGIIAISAGHEHSLALKNDGTVWVWGDNRSNQLGLNTQLNAQTIHMIPVQNSYLSGITAISASHYHSAALKSDGTVWAWGDIYYEIEGYWLYPAVPMQVSLSSGIVAISSGKNYGVALKNDGTVWDWGYNASYFTAPITSLSGIMAISAGLDHTVALKSDGTVWAWGNNSHGQLGNGTTGTQATPIQVSSLSGVKAVSAGAYYTIALKSDNTFWAWGDNSWGQFGNGITANRTTPIQITSLPDFIEISAGTSHAVARKSDGTLWAWGNNEDGQLGDGTTTNRIVPTQIKGAGGIGYFNVN